MYQLDETDLHILEILKTDGRCSYSNIAPEVHLSRVAVRERIADMMKRGIIRGFTVVIDAKAYNKMASVFLDIEVEPTELERVAKKLVEIEEIAIVSQHTGVTGLHVHAYIDSLENLSRFLKEHIFPIQGVKNVESHVLIRQFKTNPYLARYSDE